MPSVEEIWRRYDADEQRLSTPLTERMLDLVALRPGMRVLDLATGRGEPAIPAARRVAPNGSVVGVDVAGAMLQMARERAAREAVRNLELLAMNAEAMDDLPRAHFHAALCRWGLMYFSAPMAALTSVRRALVPGGVLVAALWAEPERVEYHSLPRRALAAVARVPPIDRDAPGTFYYADRHRIARDFAAAGLTITHVEELRVDVMEARDDAALVAWTRAFGMARLLDPLPAATQRAWEAELVRGAAPYRKDGVVRLGGITRVVVASAG